MYDYAARVWAETTEVGERVFTIVVNGTFVIVFCTDVGLKYMPAFNVLSCCFLVYKLPLSKVKSVVSENCSILR